jgi:internalin A
MKFPLLSALGVTLLVAMAARGQPAPSAPPAPAQCTVSPDGKTLTVKAKATVADLDAACKAHASELTTIAFDWGNESIDSFAPLAEVKGLKSLKTMSVRASEKKPIDVTPLAGLTELEEVDFYGTHIKNVPALVTLKKVKTLSFYMSDVDSIDCIKGMPNLQVLTLYGFGHTFKDYTPLLGLKKLRSLDIYMNHQATDALLAPLAALTSLDTIQMANDGEVTTLAFLKGCKDMETIGASWCHKLKDISAMQAMDQLENLSLDDTAITDIAPLAGRIYLRSLNISGTKVSDLMPLQKCRILETLNIAKTPVTDVIPLLKCRKLTRLQVSGSVPQAQIDQLKEALPRLVVDVQK